MADDAIQVFGTPVTAVTTTATVSDGYVVGGQAELDNSSELYLLATAVINITDTFGAAPTGTIDLYMVRGDVDGTTDGTALGYAALTNSSAQTDSEYAEFVNNFNPNVDEAYVDTINISLAGVKKAKFYIQNSTNTTLVYSSNAITVKITPFTLTPST